jgi:hypothetical protein
MKLYYYEEGKSFHCYTSCGCSYDVFGLCQKVFENRNQELSFTASVDYVARTTGKQFGFGFGIELEKEEKMNEELQWMQRMSKKKRVELPELEVYSKKILDVFSNIHHPEFLKDNISHEAMTKFNILYYNKDNRIVIPHYHPLTGDLIGIRGRALNQWEIDSGYKYLPTSVQGKMYNFPSYGQLYGMYQNQDVIKKLRKVVLFESEKSVLQCESYFKDSNFAVSMMGRNISSMQIEMLLKLGIEEIIIATDRMYKEHGSEEERRDIEYLIKLGRKFSPYVRTYVLFDEFDETKYKSSPSDFGTKTLISLMKNKKEILNLE